MTRNHQYFMYNECQVAKTEIIWVINTQKKGKPIKNAWFVNIHPSLHLETVSRAFRMIIATDYYKTLLPLRLK